MTDQLVVPHRRIIDMLSTYHPFSLVGQCDLRGMGIMKTTLKRGSVLTPQADHLYHVVYGQAAELGQGYGVRKAMLGRFTAGSVIGWYPIEGVILCERETSFLVIPKQWRDFEVLVRFQRRAMKERLLELGRLLALQMTTSVAERIRILPLQPGETKTELAMRVGCSREMVSKVLSEADRHDLL